MKRTLPREDRRKLETLVAQARVVAEAGAQKALHALSVAAKEAPGHASEAQKKLRVRLRAHGRQLGDRLYLDDKQAINRLINEIAYEHWHRMLFARFLAENDLLMHPDGYPVSLPDCKDDAAILSPPARSEWEVAGRYASAMLPNVFRPDSPVLALELPMETEQALEALLQKLSVDAFAADDSLGWSYQFWQASKKEEVQRQMKNAGSKVGADELPAVTQLFTEPYMVAFLLENSLGGWWLGRHPEKPLPVAMPYLRRVEAASSRLNETRLEVASTPAAGTFPSWPETLAEFKLLDPCCGSGHFLVAALHYLVPMRAALEGLTIHNAIHSVLSDNLHGLELDARCVEIAAFALALAAWRYPDENGVPLGYRPLPRLNIACCGIAPRSKKADWLKLANGEQHLEEGMAALYALFQKAPELGSLLDPHNFLPSHTGGEGDLLNAGWEEVAALLEQALANTNPTVDVEAHGAAQGMALTTRILTGRYHLVVTNPPYLGAGQHGPILKDFCEAHYKTAKGDLANVFLERSLKLCKPGGTVQFVMPQNWLFLGSYKKQRERLLKQETWNLLARLGVGAFETISGEVVNAILLTLTHVKAPVEAASTLRGIDASGPRTPEGKAELLRTGEVVEVSQAGQLENPDARVSFSNIQSASFLFKFAAYGKGSTTGDSPRFLICFWELLRLGYDNHLWLDSPKQGDLWSGRYLVCNVSLDNLALTTQFGCRIHGQEVWGRHGVAVNKMRELEPMLYYGEVFDDNICLIVPTEESQISAILAFVENKSYRESVREIDRSLKVTAATLVKVPFDLAYWQQIAAEHYPNDLPEPYSDDPTQWIFHGHPKPSTDPLQVAVARLLGYRWPAETSSTPDTVELTPSPHEGKSIAEGVPGWGRVIDGEASDLDSPHPNPPPMGEGSKMELSTEARTWIARCVELADLSDDDGIVCLPPVRGEPMAVDRLRALLARAFGEDWSAAREAQLLKDVGCDGMTLNQWLRDKFFEQHVARFHRRPFIWHVWDGHKEGFSALLNYHTLTREKLQTLTHTYLGDWITQLRRAVTDNADASLKLAKAEALKTKLEAILEGDPPYDIFVRWKPLAQQPIGWEPDINDGVRLNIRPFVEAEVLRIARAKLGIKWDADRGKDVPSAPWYTLGPHYGEPVGTRINNHHISLAEKRVEAASSRLLGMRLEGASTETRQDAAEVEQRIQSLRNDWGDDS